MHVLMLGWEFPPYITGGLGTACHGLTKALAGRGVHVTFVLPVTLPREQPGPLAAVRFISVSSGLVHPYQRRAGEGPVGAGGRVAIGPGAPGGVEPGLVGQVDRYARLCANAVRDIEFDIVHAHDWMAYPAGERIARAHGRPLVAHVHSTEHDRSGEHVDAGVVAIERRGVRAADRVIAVSRRTRDIVVERYGVPAGRVIVVHNAVEGPMRRPAPARPPGDGQVVLYFGRITFQKGPEYFLRAARRVLDVADDVRFVVAGAGDMAERMVELAGELGLGDRVEFTGFLRGAAIDAVFDRAELFVMPSVSEPFGIAALEALRHGVPVLISRTSGVSEVLEHALKVDFWDVEDMADKILAVLRHPALARTLREAGAQEVERLTWAVAAETCETVYRALVPTPRAPTA